MKTRKELITLLFGVLIVANMTAQQVRTITVDADKPGSAIQPTMWGIFFEDINMAADGGLYAELVKNRSFEFSMPMMGWEVIHSNSAVQVQVLNQGDIRPSNPRYVHVTMDENVNEASLSNTGFRGMGVKKDLTYHFSILARLLSGSSFDIRVDLVDSKRNVIGSGSFSPNTADWKKYTVDLVSEATDPGASLNITFVGKGSMDIDVVSLFPDDTWKKRPGGLRADLVQLLADLKPGFVRFPGGCIVEGRDLANRYQWKNTVGNVEDRRLIVNRWNTEFQHRLTPDYFQTFGLGFYEYFLLAEDIGAEPLPILNCGMACQFNTAELVPIEQLDTYIQDALDLIEFANGSADSPWGRLRASMGHPLPFNLKMIGVGNEQWGPQYIERYKAFAVAIKAKYPEIRLVSGTGPSPDGDLFTYAAAELKKLGADIVDEHYYANPSWFLQNAGRYDSYDRNGYRIFAGEYAAQSKSTTSPDNQNTWECALAEAAFMTGLERNADIVNLCSYAPLFAHVEGWQWRPDLIWFDNLVSFGSANYYIQKLYSTNRGTHVLPLLENNTPLTGQDGLYGTAAFDKATGEVILKLANAKDAPSQVSVRIIGANRKTGIGKVQVMQSADLNRVNSLQEPVAIAPADEVLPWKGSVVVRELSPFSFTVIRCKIR
jgi:alpha-N-arabinofuranosidase